MDRQRGGGRASPSTLTTHEHATQDPFPLYSINRELVLDLLSVHLTRNVDNSVLISYHPLDHSITKAKHLGDRIRFAGQSVYWQRIFQVSPDPTFILLVFIWHTLYAWDEALQDLYTHISSLESRVIKTYDIILTQELHNIRANQVHYYSLIKDLRKTVEFVRDTKNPAMDSFSNSIRKQSKKLMQRECRNLLNEIRRLEKGRLMWDQRLKNAMNLVFSSVNIDDSKQMQRMTEVTVKDNAAMKQISYVTMVCLPASFVAAVFGMNIFPFVPGATGTLGHYFVVVIALTVLTAWVIVAFQSECFYPEETPLWKRFGWPVMLLQEWIDNMAKMEN